ncbi:MAG: paraquat-inducible protein A [Crocinitomicaceae bacterium]|nr:paraquat-inducible protein A [Crocinitomicaceae bacterium]
MKKFTFLFVSFIILFSTVVYFTFSISENLSKYHDKKSEISKELNFENRLMNAWEWVPFNTIGQEKVETWRALEISASYYYKKACIYGYILGGVVLLFTCANLLYYRKRDHKLQIYGLVMVFSALSFLYLGLQSPFLEIEAYNADLAFDIPLDVNTNEIPFLGELDLGGYHYELNQVFEGRIYYLYQNKSVLQLIKLLYTGGNFLVAICVILFSIVFPLVKLFSSMIIFMNPHSKSSHKLTPAIVYLGKWSMADVFISAMFLAVFSFTNMNEGIDTGASTLIGMYFFLSFVILSILSGFVLKKLVQKKKEATLDYV